MDLFTPLISAAQQHANFRFMTQAGLCQPEMEVMQAWADEFKDEDGHFVQEFQTTFNTPFWQLYLSACFKELGCEITAPLTQNFSVCFPQVNAQQFTVATTNSNFSLGFAADSGQELALLREMNAFDDLQLTTVRLANAIATQHRTYLEQINSGKAAPNKPVILGLAPFDASSLYFQDILAIDRLLYGCAVTPEILDAAMNEFILGSQPQPTCTQQESDSGLKLGLFTQPGMAEISAIIFNNRTTFAKVRALANPGHYPVLFQGSRIVRSPQGFTFQPFAEFRPHYQETLLDGLQIAINPFAKYPLDLTIFQNREVVIHTYDSESNRCVVKLPDRFLLHRRYQSFIAETVFQKLQFVGHAKVNREVIPAVWQEDQLMYVGGRNGPFRDNHIAHYHSWTIMISFDPIDQDWGAQAVHCLCYSVLQFMEANWDDNIASLRVRDWFPHKADAYNAIKQKIDQQRDSPVLETM